MWEFTDPKAEAPPVLPAKVNMSGYARITVERPEGGDEYTDFDISTNGRRVAALWKSAKGKYAVHVFELKPVQTATKLTRVGTFDLGAEGATAVRISADGKTIVTFRPLAGGSGRECTATAWDVATGKPGKPVRATYSLGTGWDWAPWSWPALTPDGRELVDSISTAKNGGYDLVELATGQRRKLALKPLPGEDSNEHYSGRNLCFPSGSVHVEAGHRHTRIVDLTTGKELGRLGGHASAPTALAVSADETRIATADDSGLIRLWDAKTLRALSDAPGHRLPVEYAQLSPDGKRLLTWSFDDTTRLWDLNTGKELRAFTGEHGVNTSSDQPTFTPDGTTILFNYKERLIARDIQTGLEIPLPGEMKELPPRLAVFSPDGKSVLTWTVGHDEICDVWDWPSGKKRFSWKDERLSFDPGFSSDSSVIFPSVTSPTRLRAKTGEGLPPAWEDERRLTPIVSLRPAPRWMWDSSDRFVPKVLDVGTGKLISRFRFGTRNTWPKHMAVSPTGGHIAWVADELPGEVSVFESVSCDVRRTLSGHRHGVRVLGFTPDGTKLLTAGGDHTVLVWDMRLQNVPLPDAVKKETNAAKLWDTLATGNAKDAYLAMARLAREPDAALAMAKMHLKPATTAVRGTDAANVADARAAELLEALDTDDSRRLLKELAGGHADAFRTQEAKRALERHR